MGRTEAGSWPQSLKLSHFNEIKRKYSEICTENYWQEFKTTRDKLSSKSWCGSMRRHQHHHPGKLIQNLRKQNLVEFGKIEEDYLSPGKRRQTKEVQARSNALSPPPAQSPSSPSTRSVRPRGRRQRMPGSAEY